MQGQPTAKRLLRVIVRYWETLVILGTPLAWIWLFFIDQSAAPPLAMRCLFVLMVMATFWCTNALPLPITALIPAVLFPAFGISSSSTVCKSYFNSTSMMFMGGIMMAIGLENSGLHKRVAIRILLLVGTSFVRMLLSIMMVTCFLSMWISNTATTAMMVPIVKTLAEIQPKELQQQQRAVNNDGFMRKRLNIMLLAVAYSANIGGTGVITGTATNLVILKELPPESGVNFTSWMAFAIPLMLANIAISWLWLAFGAPRVMPDGNQVGEMVDLAENVNHGYSGPSGDANGNRDNLPIEDRHPAGNKPEPLGLPEQQRQPEEVLPSMEDSLKAFKKDLGQISLKEILMAITFVSLVLLWIFQQPKSIPGWADALEGVDRNGDPAAIGEDFTVIAIVIIVFILPGKNPFALERRTPDSDLLNWKLVQSKMEWGILILLGGGFALSDGIKASGLSQWFVDYLVVLKSLNIKVVNLLVSLITATVTEVASNTATATILSPILKQTSAILCVNPVYLVLPSILSCSYAFMLPVATPPNAIVFSASDMRLKDMLMTGFIVNIACVLMTVLAINTWGYPLFGLDEMPEWANKIALKYGVNCTGVPDGTL